MIVAELASAEQGQGDCRNVQDEGSECRGECAATAELARRRRWQSCFTTIADGFKSKARGRQVLDRAAMATCNEKWIVRRWPRRGHDIRVSRWTGGQNNRKRFTRYAAGP